MDTTHLLDSRAIDRIISRIAHEITEKKEFDQDTILAGIRTRGIYIASRLHSKIKEIEGTSLPVGSLDISFHRDDLTIRNTLPNVGTTDIPVSIDEKTVILVDDVLYTGRTIRAALDELTDLGRPARILLAVLIDRGHRQMPIKADFVGKNIPTRDAEVIKVHLNESDGIDEVILQCL